MYGLSSFEFCHEALVSWSLASLQSLLSILPLAFQIPGRMASSFCTLDSFSPQSFCSCSSLCQVCCSPNSSRGCFSSGGLPFGGTSGEPFLDRPSKKSPLLFSLIGNNIFPSEHVLSFVIIFLFVLIWLIYASSVKTRELHEWVLHLCGSSCTPAPYIMPGTQP